MSDRITSHLTTPLIEASHTNDIPSSASSAPQGTKNSIVGTLAGKAVQAMLPGAQRGLSTMLKLAKKYKVPSTQEKPPKSNYPSWLGGPSPLTEPLLSPKGLSPKGQSDYKTADAENTGETPPAYEPPTLPNSVQ